MPVPELEQFRKKYPDYGDMSDTELAGKLAAKYPDAYGDLPGKVSNQAQAPGEIDAKVGGSQQITGSTQPKPYEPYGTLGREFKGGLSDIGGGLSDVVNGIKQALTPPDPQNFGRNADPVEGLMQAITGLGKATLGAARSVTSPIPAAGDIVGEVSGEAVRSATQPLLGPTGSALAGSLVGASFNTATQLWAAPYAIAKAAPILTGLVQGGASRLPGAQVTLRQLASKAVEAWPIKMAPAEASKDLYNKLAQINPKLVMPELNAIANKLDKLESIRAEFGVGNAGVQTAASKIAEATAGPARGAYKEIPFDVAQTVMQRIGARVGQLRQEGGEALGEYKQLYKGVIQSLENATNNSQPGNAQAAFALLKKANKSANTEFALGELQDIITKNLGKALEGTGLTSSNFAKTLNDVNKFADDNPLFKQGLGDANFKTITENLDQFRQLKLRPPLKTANSAPFWERASIGSIIGGGVGHMVGNTQVGIELGAAISGGLPPLISRVVQSKAGTHALTDILQRTGTVTPQQITSIMAIIRGEQAMAENMPDAVIKALKGRDMTIEEKIQAVNMQDTIFKTAAQGQLDLTRSP